MKTSNALYSIILLLLVSQPALAQRQLQCEDGDDCKITCYQDGMDNAEKIFHREDIETLQVDLTARVLKIEFREEKKPRAYDYFILGSEMSCTIENMRGMHD